MFVGDTWKETNFSFSRMNIFFCFLVVRLEIWDGREGQLKMPKFFFLFGGFLFLFLNLNAIFSRGYGEISAALDIYIYMSLVYLPR